MTKKHRTKPPEPPDRKPASFLPEQILRELRERQRRKDKTETSEE